MLFKILSKEQFDVLCEVILESDEIIAPKRIGTRHDGRPIHQYLPVTSRSEIDLDYQTTEYSAKTYFLPYNERLSTYRLGADDWEQSIEYRLQPRAIVGLHACDIHALLKLDRVMIRDSFPSPYYLSRRQNTFIVGIDHEACEGGFCRSLGTDTVTHGFDLFLTDLGDRYFVAIDSDRGFTVLNRVAVRDVTDADGDDYLQVRRRIAASHGPIVPMHNLPTILDLEFESRVWAAYGARCLGCGSCAMVCPTCYCYGVTETVSMDGTSATKRKQLYACTLVDFAEVAGGHNFRPDRETRLKYRYYHQHRGFVEAYEEPKCVGCGRCGEVCLAGIKPPDVIRDLQSEELT